MEYSEDTTEVSATPRGEGMIANAEQYNVESRTATDIFNDIEKQKSEVAGEYNQGTGAGKDNDIDSIAPCPTAAAILLPFAVTREYVEKLGNEEFLYDNLIIKGHIVVIIALSGGGKTTFLLRSVVPNLVKQDFKVFYVDADAPATDHKQMLNQADKVGFTLINPDVNLGTSIRAFLKKIGEMVKDQVDMSDHVFFFDTLKKFTDLMSKKDVKEFFRLCRGLTHCGATVVLPAHANKYRNTEGYLIPEGVGDVKSDTDELIFFERELRDDGGIDVTTVVDIDKGAKVRGIFKPFSFHITAEREVQHYDKPLEQIDHTATKAPMATDEEILVVAENYLREVGPINKTALASHLHDSMEGAGINRIKKLLSANSEVKKEGQAPRHRFVFEVVRHGAQLFELPKQPQHQPVNGELF